jgi:hypothetical protein
MDPSALVTQVDGSIFSHPPLHAMKMSSSTKEKAPGQMHSYVSETIRLLLTRLSRT